MAAFRFVYKIKSKGFSILESLIALVIMSVSLVAIFTTIGVASSAIHHNKLKTQALLLAESKLSETKLFSLTSFESFSGKSGRFAWKLEIRPTDCETLGLIDSQVNWIEKNNPQKLSLKTFVQMQY